MPERPGPLPGPRADGLHGSSASLSPDGQSESATLGDRLRQACRGFRGTARGTSADRHSVHCVLSGHIRGTSVQPVRSGRLSGLLLIRGLGVQVPGGAPVLTWRFYASAAPGRPAAWNESIRWFAAHSALTAHADGPHDHAEQSACMLAMRASPPLARLPRPAAMLTYWPFGVWVERNHNHRAATRTGSDGSAQVTRDRRHRGADDRVVEHAQQHREHDAERVQRTRPGGSVVH